MTPDDIALARADDAATRLDSMLETMRRDGTLREFNATYKRKRSAAAARGEGYMSFGIAMARLRRSLIPRLVGKSDAPMGVSRRARDTS